MEMSIYPHTLVALHLRNNPHTHGIGGWVGPRADLDILEKKNIAYPSVQSTAVTIVTPLLWLLVNKMHDTNTTVCMQ